MMKKLINQMKQRGSKSTMQPKKMEGMTMKNGMKKIMKAFVLVALACVCSMGLTGCGNHKTTKPHNGPEHVGVIYTNTKNEASVNVAAFEDKMKDVCMASESTIDVFNAEGYVDTLKVPKYKKGIPQSTKERLAKQCTVTVIQSLQGLKPSSQELDILKVLSDASRQLSTYPGEKTLYIVSSGLSTEGSLIDFTELMLEEDHSEELIKALEGNLPDMKNIRIQWIGLGEVSGAQDELYEKNRTVLKDTWTAILTACGVKESNIEFSNELSVSGDNESKKDFPYVSKVPIIKPASFVPNASVILEENLEETGEEETQIIDLQECAKFKPDSTKLIAPKDVEKTLDKFIQYLRHDKSRVCMLVGTTSSAGEQKSLQQFSLKRCMTIKKLLISKGVDASQIVTVGAGYGSNLTCNDRNKDGELIEEKAAKNRSVYLFTNVKAKESQKLLATYK